MTDLAYGLFFTTAFNLEHVLLMAHSVSQLYATMTTQQRKDF
jgi:hypothetical protein